MNGPIRNEWVQALRSGEYRQGHTWLCISRRGRERFTALGVLGDILVDGWWERGRGGVMWLQRAEPRGGRWRVARSDGYELSSSILLLREDIDSAGLRYEEMLEVGCMNNSGKTFLEIADWLESNL